jgi:hypothetical protein
VEPHIHFPIHRFAVPLHLNCVVIGKPNVRAGGSCVGGVGGDVACLGFIYCAVGGVGDDVACLGFIYCAVGGNATTKECYNERGGKLPADVARACV